MDLWIRSQDKKSLIKMNSIFIDTTDMVDKGFVIIYSQNCEFELGAYKTEERALEVLDEIQRYVILNGLSCYDINTTISVLSDIRDTQQTNKELIRSIVYEMPKE